MGESTDDFFEGKRPWSKIKDEVLGSYMQPYLAKLNRKGPRILLIDGYVDRRKKRKARLSISTGLLVLSH